MALMTAQSARGGDPDREAGVTAAVVTVRPDLRTPRAAGMAGSDVRRLLRGRPAGDAVRQIGKGVGAAGGPGGWSSAATSAG